MHMAAEMLPKKVALLEVETQDHGHRVCVRTPAGKGLLYVKDGKLFSAYLMGPPSKLVADSARKIGDVQDLLTLHGNGNGKSFKAWSEEHGETRCVDASLDSLESSLFPKCLCRHKGLIYSADKRGLQTFPCTAWPRIVGTLEDVVGVCKFMRQEGKEDGGCDALLDQHA